MRTTRAMFRASRIGRVMLRYRLDDLFDGTPAERWLRIARPFVPRARAHSGIDQGQFDVVQSGRAREQIESLKNESNFA